MASTKRKVDDALVVHSGIKEKRARTELVTKSDDSHALVVKETRTSGLEAPNMLLTGHEAAVECMKFDPTGQMIASGSFDKTIFIWEVYGECANTMVLRGHKNSVLDIHWSTDGSTLFSASADKTIGVWDIEAGQRIKKFSGHTGIVNACAAARRGPSLVCSASDDGTVKLWDTRSKRPVQSFDGKYQATACCFSDNSDTIFAGGLDNTIRGWDLRTGGVSMTLAGHRDTITYLACSPDGAHLLSNAMDRQLCAWDVRPFSASTHRLVRSFVGHQHNFEKALLKCSWAPSGDKVAAGSSDRLAYVWDFDSAAMLYRLPGHSGSVNEVAFHPKEPIIGSCSKDKKIFIGEIAN